MLYNLHQEQFSRGTMNHTNNRLVIFHMDMNHTCLRADYLKKWVSKLAGMGYNAILWEVENNVQWDTCPECVHPDAMTKDQFREILAYASELGLDAIPLLQTFGHAEYVLLHDEYKSFREQPDKHDCYCSSNLEVRQFLKKWVSEYLDLFGNVKHFHLGGDEAYVFGSCPACKMAIEQSSANSLYAEHLLDVGAEIINKGILPGIWGDMLLHHPNDINQIPPEFIIWDWNYWDGLEFPKQVRTCGDKHIKTAADITEKEKEITPEIMDNQGNLRPFYTTDFLLRVGRKVILCSSSRSSGDNFFLPFYNVHMNNIIGAAKKTCSANLLGNCVTSWAIRFNTYETQEPLLKLAVQSLNAPEKNADVLIDSSSGTIMHLIPKHNKEINFLLNQLSAVQHTGLKDSLPAPKNHLRKLMETFSNPANPNHKAWEKRISNCKSLINELSESRVQLDESNSEYKKAFQDAIEIEMRHLKALLALFEEDYNYALKEFHQLKQDFKNYLSLSQGPFSAERNSALVFDPLIEYCTTAS